MVVNGILNVNKPAGPTSFRIVANLRKLIGERRVGHAGTLDPAACGVLPICLGQATRITEYLMLAAKEYIAVVELGTSTDTYDGEGQITGRGNYHEVSLADIQIALKNYSGTFEQRPPAFSALKKNGKRFYELARAGHHILPATRQVKIDSLEILEFEPPCLKLKISCSKGTYIRSLAHDLGQLLGCGAYLKHLTRTAYGPFRIEDAVSPDKIEKYVREGKLEDSLYPLDFPFANWEKTVLSADLVLEVIKGHDIALNTGAPPGNIFRLAYNLQGKPTAIMKFIPESGLWHPHKVFNL